MDTDQHLAPVVVVAVKLFSNEQVKFISASMITFSVDHPRFFAIALLLLLLLHSTSGCLLNFGVEKAI